MGKSETLSTTMDKVRPPRSTVTEQMEHIVQIKTCAITTKTLFSKCYVQYSICIIRSSSALMTQWGPDQYLSYWADTDTDTKEKR